MIPLPPLLVVLLASAASPVPSIYSWPAAAPRSAEYAVTVNGKKADVLQHQGFSWLSFSSDFQLPVTVEVTPLRAAGVPVAAATARPLRHRVQPTLIANRSAVTIELTAAAKLSVEIELLVASSLLASSTVPTCAQGAANPARRVACSGAGAGVTSSECARLGCCFTSGPGIRRRDCVKMLHPSLPLVGTAIGMEMGCQQNDSLADG